MYEILKNILFKPNLHVDMFEGLLVPVIGGMIETLCSVLLTCFFLKIINTIKILAGLSTITNQIYLVTFYME